MSVRETSKNARREKILIAAEKLIRQDDRVGFSMRALSKEAGVAFATPFNLFENKSGVLYGLLEKRIEAQTEQILASHSELDPIDRLFEQAILGSEMYLADPALYKPILQTISNEGPRAGKLTDVSVKLWSTALQGALETGLLEKPEDLALVARSIQLGFASLLLQWAVGQLSDEELRLQSQLSAAVSLMTVLTDDGRLQVLEKVRPMSQTTKGQRQTKRKRG